MIDSLPQDQAALIVERLGATRVSELAEGCPDAGTLYRRCVQEMGPYSGNGRGPRLPSPAYAWLEIQEQRKKVAFDEEPTFSHPKVAETVAYFGGWKKFWTQNVGVAEHITRNRFIMAFKEIADG